MSKEKETDNQDNKPRVRRLVNLSWIKAEIEKEFEEMRQDPWLDPDFFTDEEAEHYLGVILRQHLDDWYVIDDTKDGQV